MAAGAAVGVGALTSGGLTTPRPAPATSALSVIPASRARVNSSASFVLSDGENVPRLMALPKTLETLDPTAFSARSIAGSLRAKSGSLAAFATILYKAGPARSTAAGNATAGSPAKLTPPSSSEIICATCAAPVSTPVIASRSASVKSVLANWPSEVTRPASVSVLIVLSPDVPCLSAACTAFVPAAIAVLIST